MRTPSHLAGFGFLGAVLAGAALAAAAGTTAAADMSAAADTPRHPYELTLPPLQFELAEMAKDTLACRIPVYGVENHDLPLVTIAVRFRLGHRYVAPEEFTALDLLGDVWATGGTRDLDPDAFDRRAVELDVDLSAGTGQLSSHVTASCVREDLEDVLQLWRDVVVQPRFAPDRLERARGKRLQEIQSMNDDPSLIAQAWFQWLALGREYLGGHVASRAELESVTAEDLHELHRHFVHPGNALIGISGDYDRAELLPLLDELFAGWKKSSANAPPPEPADWPVAPEPGVYVVRGDFAQAQVFVGHHVADLEKLSPEYPATQILDFALGYGRVFYRSRAMGISYGASVYLHVENDDPLLQGSGSCRPEAATDLAAMLLEEMQGIRNHPLGDEEIETSRAFRVGLLISDSEVPRALIRSRLADLAEGRPEDFQDRYLRGLQQCTAHDLATLVEQRFLPPEEMVVLVVGDPDRFARPLEDLGLGAPQELEPVIFGD